MLIKNIIMLLLAVTCLLLLGVEYLYNLSALATLRIEWFEMAVGIIFLAEFIFEWYHAKNKRLYIRHHWYYLLASIPLPFQTFDILRGVRVLRVLRLFKAFSHIRYEENTRLFSK